MSEAFIYAAPAALLVVAGWDAARRYFALKSRILDDVDEAAKELASQHQAKTEKRLQELEKGLKELVLHGGQSPKLSKFARG